MNLGFMLPLIPTVVWLVKHRRLHGAQLLAATGHLRRVGYTLCCAPKYPEESVSLLW